MGTVCSLIVEIIDDKAIGASKTPGMILSGQDKDQNQDTDAEYELGGFCHFSLKMDIFLIILQLTFYPKTKQK